MTKEKKRSLKIIYLVESKFCKRDYDRFGLKRLSKRGYNDVEVWDFSPCFRLDYCGQYLPKDSLEGERYIKISNKDFAIQLLQSLSGDNVFICLIHPDKKSSYIFNYLNKKQYAYGFLSFGHMPVHGGKSFFAKALANPVYALGKLIKKINEKIYNLNAVISPSFAILGGEVAKNRYINDKTVVLKAHTLDYDLFLASSTLQKKDGKSRYAVFLDSCTVGHPDSIDSGSRAVNAERYYREINSFFKYVRLELDMPVVISPHPRSDYVKNGNPFDDCAISTQSTCDAVRDSSLVITSNSTSVSFAVLYNKPIVFLNGDVFPVHVQREIEDMVIFFHKDSIDIAAPNFAIQEKDVAVNSNIYSAYKELYIKENSTPERQTWDLFSDYLDKTYIK